MTAFRRILRILKPIVWFHLTQMQIEASRIADQERRARDLNYDRMVSEFVRKELAASEAKKMSDKVKTIFPIYSNIDCGFLMISVWIGFEWLTVGAANS